MKLFFSICALTLINSYQLHALTEPLSKKVYDDLIQPVFNAKCIECHGPNKSKGKLKLHTKKDFLIGGSGAGEDIVIKENIEDSELIYRITLPKDDDEAMPPMEDKDHYNPVSEQELNVMKAWISMGASFELLVSDLSEEAKKSAIHVLENMPKKLISKAVALQPKLPTVPAADPALLKNLRDEGILAMPIAQNTNAIYVNASYVGQIFDDKKVQLLEPLAKQILWLNLARTKVTDEGIASISKLNLLTRLHLENTSITDKAAVHLSKLTNIEYLNLYGTQVSDLSIPHLQKLKKLNKIFLWQTKITSAGADKLRKSFTDSKTYESLTATKKSLQAKLDQITVTQNKKVKKLEELTKSANSKTEDIKAINNECPVTNKITDYSIVSIFEGRKIGFCCVKCKNKFDSDGAVFRSKIKDFKASDGFILANKNLRDTLLSMEESTEQVHAQLRSVSSKLKNMSPSINLGWKSSTANN